MAKKKRAQKADLKNFSVRFLTRDGHWIIDPGPFERSDYTGLYKGRAFQLANWDKTQARYGVAVFHGRKKIKEWLK